MSSSIVTSLCEPYWAPRSALGLQDGYIGSHCYGHRGSVEFWPLSALGQSRLDDIFLQIVCGCVATRCEYIIRGPCAILNIKRIVEVSLLGSMSIACFT